MLGDYIQLKEVVQLESRREVGKVTPGDVGCARRLSATLVTVLYRPARAMLKSTVETEKTAGVEKMGEFILRSNALAGLSVVVGDAFGEMLSRHNAASALFLLGDTEQGLAINRTILGQLATMEARQKASVDWHFIYYKAFFGLMYWDKEFQNTVSLVDWISVVVALYAEHDPDYASRAAHLSRRLWTEGRREEALDLLRKAASADFCKREQVQEATEELGRRVLENSEGNPTKT